MSDKGWDQPLKLGQKGPVAHNPICLIGLG